jgi:ribosomal protein S18 acetylase RimI-like enzyme
MANPAEAPYPSARQAGPEDFGFALALYLESTKPLLIALGRWDEERVRARFVEDFTPERAQMLHADGAEIGWIQVTDNGEGLHLDQLHLIEGYRNRGIGTRLIQALLDRGRRSGKWVGLNVIRGNPAIRLYQRLGFALIGEEDDKLQMRWQDGHAPDASNRARARRSRSKKPKATKPRSRGRS